ncbi:hypothetical protein ACLMJK_003048 [Lecanora helva]
MGLPVDFVPRQWIGTNCFRHTDFSLSHLASTVKANNLKIIVIIPAKEVASTIAGVIQETVRPLVVAGIISSTVVIDANSKDRTGEIAARYGATVIQRKDIAPELGPSQGKGDALWRALKATDGDIIAFLDGDTGDPNPAHLLGILGPLLLDDRIHMVRGCFERPFKTPNGDLHANEGGRVTELTARPLLNLHFAELAVFSQPLAGEFAARRSLLESLQFPVGYGIEIATLIDAWKLVGLDGLAEVDLGTRQNAHKPLRDLAPMSLAIMSVVEKRRGNELPGRIWLPWKGQYHDVADIERPPLKFYNSHTIGINEGTKLAASKVRRPPDEMSGMCNFRDIGGYPVSSGSHLRRHLVFRSADLNGLTLVGKVKLQALSISMIFDLRRPEEIKDHMNKGSVYESWISSRDGPKRFITPVFRDDDFAPEALAQRLMGYSGESTEGTVKVYRSILLKSGAALKAILSCLCRVGRPSPILINCTAGKDRTGIIIMVLMLLAGCSAKDVAREYHLSEEGLGTQWKAEVIERLTNTPPFIGKDALTVQRAVGARVDVMKDVVTMVKRDWGGIEGFLRQELHIPEEVIRKSKQTLRA